MSARYEFEHENAKFYYPHHVTQLPTGNIMLMDDGSGRPGCMLGDESECYSRAVEYALHHDGDGGGTVKMVWQFAYPDSFSDDMSAPSARTAMDSDANSKIGTGDFNRSHSNGQAHL